MNGVVWMILWVGYLAVSLLLAAGLHRVKPTWVKHELWVALMLGAVGLFIMAWALKSGTTTALPLPHPWPALVTSPLPLSPLWSAIAGLLFGSAGLLSFHRSDRHRLAYALIPLLAGVGIYLWSGDGFLLLMSWEFISAVTYLGLITTRRARPVWNAGWALLALSELGGMLLLIALAWLMPTHSLYLHDSLGYLSGAAAHIPSGWRSVIMLLAIIAFGVKAGVFPVMIWMPLAEPEAPGLVAGIFSGLLTALAILGLLAVIKVSGSEMAWAVVLLVLGVLGALSGALYSVVSRHVKRVLAYSTLEILGLVFTAIAVWRLTSLADPSNVASTMALDAVMVLLVMHAGAKFTLFGISDWTGQWSHSLDGLGGLIHQSGKAGLVSLLAVLTLVAFPPLGGFVGEWLIFEAILKPQGHGLHLGLMVAAGGLALATAIGVAAYLRWYGFIFLGISRNPSASKGRSLGGSEMAGLGLPLLLAVISGPGVPWFLPWLNRSLAAYLTTPSAVIAPTFVRPGPAQVLVPIGVNLVPAPLAQGTVFFPQSFNVGDPYVLLFMALILTLAVAAIRRVTRHRSVRRVEPWNGGYEVFSARTSWSAEGFVHPLRLAFARFYGLQRFRTKSGGTHFYRHTIINRLEEQVYGPLILFGRSIASWVRKTQSGQTNAYVTYLWAFAALGIVIGVLSR